MTDASPIIDAIVLSVLDRVNPFLAPADEPPFDEQAVLELSEVLGVEEMLLRVARDREAPSARRYAATEALLLEQFSSWRGSPSDCRTVALALAEAMRDDHSHNRWGLPGQFTGRLGEQLLSLSDGVFDALVPLLDEHVELRIEGSEAATLSSEAHYRIADLAAYLLSCYRGVLWDAPSDVVRRDEYIATLRGKLR